MAASDGAAPPNTEPDAPADVKADGSADAPADVKAEGSATTVVAEPATSAATRFKRTLLVLAIARYVIPIAALPLVPVLLPERIHLLMLVRPGREIQLAGGGLYRTNGTGEPDLVLLFLAFLPLMVGAVWVFFWLGRAFQRELATGNGPGWLDRLVPPDTFAQLQRLLEQKGPVLAFLGRIAFLPPTIMAAAAGTSSVSPRAYLLADFAGAIVGFVSTVGAGYALGRAYERGGWWFTAIGLVVLFGIVSWATAWLRRESESQDAADDGPAGEAVQQDPRA